MILSRLANWCELHGDGSNCALNSCVRRPLKPSPRRQRRCHKAFSRPPECKKHTHHNMQKMYILIHYVYTIFPERYLRHRRSHWGILRLCDWRHRYTSKVSQVVALHLRLQVANEEVRPNLGCGLGLRTLRNCSCITSHIPSFAQFLYHDNLHRVLHLIRLLVLRRLVTSDWFSKEPAEWPRLQDFLTTAISYRQTKRKARPCFASWGICNSSNTYCFSDSMQVVEAAGNRPH